MISILFAVYLMQGILASPAQTGTVSGVLRDHTGKPLAGIRMAAVAQSQSLDEAVGASAMAGLAETDEDGRFILENVPPGKYLIAAGRLDFQTYYPGTQNPAAAIVLSVLAGATIPEINFVMDSTSSGRANPSTSIAEIPLRVRINEEKRFPVSSGGSFTSIRLEASGQTVTAPLGAQTVSVRGPTIADFRVTVGDLPPGYSVARITYDNIDLTTGTLPITPANFPAYATTLSGLSAAGAVPPSTTTLLALANSLLTAPVAAAARPPSTLIVELSAPAAGTVPGARVYGKLADTLRVPFLSGTPATVYADGTFEFSGVAPGRHVVATLNNPFGSDPLAASIVVGAQDLDGVRLQEVSVLPSDIRVPADPRPAGDRAPGTVPLARVRSVVLEEMSQAPVASGRVAIRSGAYSREYALDDKGRSPEVSLLPGNYTLELSVFGHTSTREDVTVDDKDLEVVLTTRKLF